MISSNQEEENNIKIISCNYGERKDVIEFLVKITSEEFEYVEWNNYFEHKLVEKYKIGRNIFFVATNEKDEVIGTCGALQQSKTQVKMNCFYVRKDYRSKGIGEKLYNLFMSFIEKERYEEIILCTFEKFDIAIKFYEKRGFKLYKKEDDEIWLKKKVIGG